MRLLIPTLESTTKYLLTISLGLLISSCSNDSDNTEDFVTNDRYVFATDGTAIVNTAKGVLANDGADVNSVTIQTNVTNGSTLSLATDGSFSYTPGENVKSDSFTYLATSSDGTTKSASVSISVINGIAACTILDVSQAQSTTIESNILDTDNLSFVLSSSPSKGNIALINNKTGEAEYSHNGTVRGRDDIVYSVTDEFGGSVEATYRVVLTPVRILPLGDSITQGVESNSETVIGDPDLDTPELGLRVGYRKKLFDLLTTAGYSFDFVGTETDAGTGVFSDFQHQGHPGYTDSEISGEEDPDRIKDVGFDPETDGVFKWLNANAADIILLHIGTNNIDFRTSSVYVEKILDEVRRWQSGNNYTIPLSVFVAKIIDKRNKVENTANVVNFNANVQSLVDSRITDADDLTLVDMFNGVSTSLLDPLDQVHLTPAGYEVMAQIWSDAMVDSSLLSKCE